MKVSTYNDEIVILPADKGNATVVMDALSYQQRIDDVLLDRCYKTLKQDLTKIVKGRMTKALQRLAEQGELPTPLKKHLTPVHTSALQLYGLPEIHKIMFSLCPIVSTISSPCYLLAKELARILSPLTGRTETFVKNSTHFIQRISDLTIDDDDMVSFDVTSLCTKVSIEEALSIVKDQLQEDKELDDRTPLSPAAVCDLTEVCLRGTYFHQNGKYWKQADGAAMGSRLSPIIANVYMEHFEQEAISSTTDKPKFLVRYVDDTFVIWPHGRDSLTLFHQHINNMRDPIKFTMEIEEERQIPFLDALVTEVRK